MHANLQQYQLTTLPMQTPCIRSPDGRAAMLAALVMFYLVLRLLSLQAILTAYFVFALGSV